jgi:hypothetical protein
MTTQPSTLTLQRALLSQGYALPRWGADGHAGAETTAAMRAWGKDHGCPATMPEGELARRIVSGASTVALGALLPAPAEALAFDTCAALTTIQARGMRASGYAAAARYLPEVTQAEIERLLNAGLGVWLVGHVGWVGEWVPSGALGLQQGAHLSDHARALGYPADGTIALDLEGVRGYSRTRQGALLAKVPASEILAHCRAWAGAVRAAGYRTMLYVGQGCGLSAAQLDALADCFDGFWKSGSKVPRPSCGWQVEQSDHQERWALGAPGPADDLWIDQDVLHPDDLGRSLLVLTMAERVG